MVHRTRFVRLSLQHLRARGVDAAPLLARFSLPADVETRDFVELPLESVARFAEAAAELADDADLGIHVAEATPRGAFGAAEYIALSAPTLGEAWGTMTRYAKLFSTAAHRTLDITASEMVFEFQIPGRPQAYGRHVNEFDLVRILKVSSQATGAPLCPTRVWFAHPRPASIAELARALGATPTFGLASCGLALDRRCANLSLSSSDPALSAVLAVHAQSLEEQLEALADPVLLIQHQIRAALKRRDASLEAVASAMRMSGRTLQRKLAERGATFAAVLEEVRKADAARYLTRSSMTLSEIAFSLGYSDVSTFARAFRGWTGVTPTEFRESKR